MPRTDTTKLLGNDIFITFGEGNSLGEIAAGIRQLRQLGYEIKANPSLRDVAVKALQIYGKEVKDFENWDEVAKFLDRPEVKEGTVEELGEAVEVKTTDDKEVNLGSKSLNKEQLDELLQVYEEHQDKEQLEEIAQSKTLERLTKNIGKSRVLELLKIKAEAQAKLIQEGKWREEADRISDKIVKTAVAVERLDDTNKLDQATEAKIAEEIVRASERSNTTSEAINNAQKIRIPQVGAEAEEVFRYLVETERAERVVEEKIEKLTEEVVATIKDGTHLDSQQNEYQIVKLVQERLERAWQNPAYKPAEQQIKVVSGKVVETEPELTTQIGKIIGTPLTPREEKVIKEVVGKAAAQTTDLWKPDTNTAAKEVGSMMKSLTEKGAGTAAIKKILEMRFPAGGKGLVGMMEAVNQEHQAMEQMAKEGVPAQYTKDASQQAGTVRALIYGKQPVGEAVRLINGSRKLLDGVKGAEPLLKIAAEATKDAKVMKTLAAAQRIIQIQQNFDKLTFGLGSKVLGPMSVQLGNLLKIPALEQFGVQLATKLGGESFGAMASQFAKFGFETGLRNILTQLASKGAVTAAATAEGAVVAGAEAATAATGVGIPVAVLIYVVNEVANKIKKFAKQLESFLGKALEFLGIGSAKTVDDVKNFLGKAAGATIAAAGVIATAILNLPALLMGGGAILTTVFLITFASIIGYNLFQTATTQTSSMVSPRMVGGEGVCVNKKDMTDPPGGKLANCDTSVSCTVDGVDKETFVNLAERWSAGGGTNAARCYGAVVSAAIKAGKDPTYALWAWLHESGASNYSISGVQDFGINDNSIAQNFNAQITRFMQLSPGNACPNLDYWLSYSTNYLTGGCDPDKAISGPQGTMTGKTYLEEMQDTWSWVSGKPMPSDINYHGGASCNGVADTGEEKEGENGEALMCYGGASIEPGTGGLHGTGAPRSTTPQPTRDPSIPIPPGCPITWPTDNKDLWVLQGPSGSFSHSAIEAIDIAGETVRGSNIQVTHPGVVVYSGYAGPVYGNLVIVQGKCGDKTFTTYYAHLMDNLVKTNQTLQQGTLLGHADNSGNYPAGNDHIHYELRECLPGDSPTQCQGLHTMRMNDYLPVQIPTGCTNVNTCGNVQVK